jgi:hypothetical protein
MTHAEAARKFATARNPNDGKPLQNNTRLHKRGNDYAVRLHSTDVVTIHANGTYTLNTGGWYSRTTKERINEYSPARAYQLRGKWYIGVAVPFFDGIRVDAHGREIVTRSQQTLFAA